jgi:hypothetical protein
MVRQSNHHKDHLIRLVNRMGKLLAISIRSNYRLARFISPARKP